MGVADYQGARKTQELQGGPFYPVWVGELSKEMENCGKAVFEEAMMASLLSDLTRF